MKTRPFELTDPLVANWYVNEMTENLLQIIFLLVPHFVVVAIFGFGSCLALLFLFPGIACISFVPSKILRGRTERRNFYYGMRCVHMA